MTPALFGFTFHAMGGPNEIQLYEENREKAEKLAQLVITDVKHIEQKYSRYLPDSIISKINAAAGGSRVQVDNETAALIDYAKTCFSQSDGLFDITSGILRRVWNFKEGVLPAKEAVREILPLVGWEKVEWRTSSVRLPK